MAVCAFAAETLFSNYALDVNASGKVGSFWVFSRGDLYSGVTLLSVEEASDGTVRVAGSSQGQIADSLTAVQDGIFSDVLAEHRRTPSIYAGKYGYMLPMYGMDDDGRFLQPKGFFSIRGVRENEVISNNLSVPDAFEDTDSAMVYAVGGFAMDSSAKRIWIARGSAGLGLYDFSGTSARHALYAPNLETVTLDSAKASYKYKAAKNPDVFGVALHPETGELWMATSKGMWKRSKDGKLAKASATLDSARVTGVWIGGKPLQIIAETSSMKKGSMKGGLWRLKEGKKDFAEVAFIDLDGKVVKKNVYDNGDYTVSAVAFLEEKAFVSVMASGGSVSGYLRLDSAGARAWDAEDGNSMWLHGYEYGVTDRNVMITSICTFPLSKNKTGLAVSTYGNGVSVSADGGKHWTSILNRAKLDNDLGSVRMVPSVITAGDQSLVSYKVGRDASKITIEVFSYDMRKVRTIVKNVPRNKDNSRSTNPKEDFWDGLDDMGRPCTMGVYYVRVKDNHDHVGWGKVMTLGGHK